MDDCLPPGEVQDYLNKIPYPRVKAVLDNAITPLTDRAKQGVRPNPDNQKSGPEVTVGTRPARLATTNYYQLEAGTAGGPSPLPSGQA